MIFSCIFLPNWINISLYLYFKNINQVLEYPTFSEILQKKLYRKKTIKKHLVFIHAAKSLRKCKKFHTYFHTKQKLKRNMN